MSLAWAKPIFSCPSGTRRNLTGHPAMNRRATFVRPFQGRSQKCPNSRDARERVQVTLLRDRVAIPQKPYHRNPIWGIATPVTRERDPTITPRRSRGRVTWTRGSASLPSHADDRCRLDGCCGRERRLDDVLEAKVRYLDNFD